MNTFSRRQLRYLTTNRMLVPGHSIYKWDSNRPVLSGCHSPLHSPHKYLFMSSSHDTVHAECQAILCRVLVTWRGQTHQHASGMSEMWLGDKERRKKFPCQGEKLTRGNSAGTWQDTRHVHFSALIYGTGNDAYLYANQVR
jgi:hypothetical protein